MNLKSILAVCALALVSVNADARTDAARQCNKKNGLFLESREDPSDTRYACLTYHAQGDERTKYCVNYDDMPLCYEKSLGNIGYCKKNTWEYNGRGCALGLGYLYNMYKDDNKKHDLSKKECPKKGGIFLEMTNDVTDFRYACLLPEKRNDENTKYCVTYDDKPLCYASEYGNIGYCNKGDSNYNGRGCALGLGYLYDMYRFENEKRQLCRDTCTQRGGYRLENPQDPEDKRFACLLPKKRNDENTKYCVTYDDIPLCYDPDLGNIAYCELNSLEYNSRGCALGLSYLWNYKKH